MCVGAADSGRREVKGAGEAGGHLKEARTGQTDKIEGSITQQGGGAQGHPESQGALRSPAAVSKGAHTSMGVESRSSHPQITTREA